MQIYTEVQTKIHSGAESQGLSTLILQPKQCDDSLTV